MFWRRLKLPDAHTRVKAREAAHERLVNTFLSSPESTANPLLQEVDCDEEAIEVSVWTLIGFAERYLDAYLATFDATQMEDLLLDIFPRVLLLPRANPPRTFLLILEQFWRFLDRAFQQPHAQAVLERLSQIGDTFEQRMALPRSGEGMGPRPATVSRFQDLTEPFDLHALDEDDDPEEDLEENLEEESWEDYRDGLVTHFRASPEGLPLLDSDLDHEDWLEFYLEYGRNYYALPPDLNQSDTRMLLMEDLPRKITPSKDSCPEDAIPVLIAFWRYLQRAHQHPAAKEVLDYLQRKGLGQQFREAIFDPARGGPAKQFLMAGQQAGYDMSDSRQVDKFQAQFNASLNRGLPLAGEKLTLPMGEPSYDPLPAGGATDPHKKRKRKAAKAAKATRKANKSKKKKK